MTNEEILAAAMTKARPNGFDRGTVKADRIIGKFMDNYPQIIFTHQFAKAFWGEGVVDEFGDEPEIMTPKQIQAHVPTRRTHITQGNFIYTSEQVGKMQAAWGYHLQEMVLEENPIKYLEKFL